MIVTDWQARHGLNATTYQQQSDQLVAEGYRLVKVSG
jgi:polyglycine hydrolase-like protein